VSARFLLLPADAESLTRSLGGPPAALDPPNAGANLFVLSAQNLPHRRIHEMSPLAGKARDRPVAFGLIRNVFGYKALDAIAGVRAALEEGHHSVRFSLPPN
jgi:hypothetical protein